MRRNSGTLSFRFHPTAPCLAVAAGIVLSSACASYSAYSDSENGKPKVAKGVTLLTKSGPSQKPYTVSAQRPGLSLSLKGKLSNSLVATGRVVGVLREAFSPYNGNGPMQHTVFSFRIDNLIKDDYRVRDRIIKVRQDMGNLPWEADGKSGVGFRFAGEPMLEVGKRYLLFLGKPSLPPSLGHHVASVDGVTGKSGDLDEFMMRAGVYDQILIEDGRLVRPQVDAETPKKPWKFRNGPQLLGLSEQQAIVLIQKVEQERALEQKALMNRAKRETERQLKLPRTPFRSTLPGG